MVGNTDPESADVLASDPESEKYRDLPFRSPAALEVFDYGFKLADERRGGEGTDLVSRLVNGTPIDGIPVDDRDFRNYFLLLVVAGNETTRHTISHTMHHLINNPDQVEILRADPSKIEWAVEEFPSDCPPDRIEEVLKARLKVRIRRDYGSVMAMILIGVLVNVITRLILEWWFERRSHRVLMEGWQRNALEAASIPPRPPAA
jgi:hypothetical protein